MRDRGASRDPYGAGPLSEKERGSLTTPQHKHT